MTGQWDWSIESPRSAGDVEFSEDFHTPAFDGVTIPDGELNILRDSTVCPRRTWWSEKPLKVHSTTSRTKSSCR